MTAAVRPTAPSGATGQSRGATGTPRPGWLLRSEWTKLRSVRSTFWSLAALLVVSVGLTVLIMSLTAAHWNDGGNGSDRARIVGDPASFVLGVGLSLAQLAMAVLGVLVITTEYSTGVIRASLLAVPRRTPMLLGKAVVLGLVALVVGEIVAFADFFIGSALLHEHAPVSLGDAGVLRAVLGVGLYLCVLALFAMGVGSILRNTPAGITAVIALILVVPPLLGLIPGSVGHHLEAYMPTQAGSLIIQTRRASDDLLGPWQGFGVFCLWAVVALAVGGALLRRRDA